MIELSPRLFIDGAWREPQGDGRIAVVSPSSEDVIGYAADATETEVDLAVASARRAFDEGPWPRMSVGERTAILATAGAAFSKLGDEIGRLVTSEMGAPLSVSVSSVTRVDATVGFLAGLARSVSLADFRPDVGPALVVREPVGVVAAITPWNGPVGMAVTKIVPALLSGCTVVFKPAPETPFDVGYLADALSAAGLPPGVLNVVSGGIKAGRSLVRHPGIDKVSFTGSTAAGSEIGGIAGAQFKRMQLELGGKSAAIVLDDADLDQVRAGLAVGCFFNSGQVCAALSRVLAPRKLYDDVLNELVRAASGWVVGDPFDPATTLGPLVSRRQLEKAHSFIDSGIAAGARVVHGGGRPEGLAKGWYIEPTVVADVDNSMEIARQEIFGPVAVVIPYGDVDEAVRIANDSDYGLHGAVFTTDPARAMDLSRRVRTGTFSVNNFVYNNRAPFGGVKNSGVGRDTGKEGYESFFELKTVNLDARTASLFS